MIHQGRRGRGPGPDFRDAVLAGPSGLPLRGDIELHLRAGSFRDHGHHRDPAYDRLLLHVVLEDDGAADTRLRSGRRVPVVALAPWVARRRQELERWLARPPLLREPCAGALAALGETAVGGLLDELGDRRLAEKAGRLRERAAAAGWDQALWEGLLEALGYGGSRELLAAVAQRVSWEDAARLAEAGSSLPRPLERALLAAARAPGGAASAPGRPANRPEVRLRAAARLAVRYRTGLAQLLALLPAERAADLVRAFVVRDGEVRLGRGRAVEIAVNVLLPAALAAGRTGVREACEALPAGRYGRLSALREALAGLPLNARRGQGLLALEREHCRRGGCGACPLAARPRNA